MQFTVKSVFSFRTICSPRGGELCLLSFRFTAHVVETVLIQQWHQSGKHWSDHFLWSCFCIRSDPVSTTVVEQQTTLLLPRCRNQNWLNWLLPGCHWHCIREQAQESPYFLPLCSQMVISPINVLLSCQALHFTQFAVENRCNRCQEEKNVLPNFSQLGAGLYPLLAFAPISLACTTGWQHAHDANKMILVGTIFTMVTISVYCVSMLTLAEYFKVPMWSHWQLWMPFSCDDQQEKQLFVWKWWLLKRLA